MALNPRPRNVALEELLDSGGITGLRFSEPTQTNAVFAVTANDAPDRIREKSQFYDWDASLLKCADDRFRHNGSWLSTRS